MTVVYTMVNGKPIVSKSVRSLCQVITNKGLNVPDVQYEVFDFYDETDVDKKSKVIQYDSESDTWFIVFPDKYVPEQIIPAHYIPGHRKTIPRTNGLKPRVPPTPKMLK